MSALVRAFQDSLTGAGRGPMLDGADVERSLVALFERGRAAYPKLSVAEEAFGRHVARGVVEGPPCALEGLAAEDLYLACACVERLRGAAEAFEVAYGNTIRRAVSRVAMTTSDRDEMEQRARNHLLLGDSGTNPAIARYRGHVPLARWIVVVAYRVAITARRADDVERRLREKSVVEAIGVTPERLYMQVELRQVIEPAVAEALARLGDRDRLILRLYLASGMSVRAIGATLGLSHQAIVKRLAKVREKLMADIRRTVAAGLKIPEDELASVMRFVASQLNVSVSGVLRAS